MRNEEFDIFLKDTETAISRLAALYDQWFMGFERHEPHVARRDVEKRLDVLRKTAPNNTALKFRTQTIIQRWTTLREHWAKVGRQIEEGTYRRDVLRARKRAEQAKAPQKKEEVHTIGLDDALAALDGDTMDALLSGFGDTKPAPLRADEGKAAVVAPPPPRLRADEGKAGVVAPPPPRAAIPKPAAPRAPYSPEEEAAVVIPQKVPPPPPPARAAGAPAPPPRPPAPPTPAGVAKPAHVAPAPVAKPAPPAPPSAPRPPIAPPSAPRPVVAAPAETVAEPRMRAIYDQYVQKRRENNEPVDNVKYEALAASIKKMVPELEKKHQGKKIDFEVVVKDGKVGLKPVTR